MTPSELYNKRCQQYSLNRDAKQLRIIKRLDKIHSTLITQPQQNRHWLKRYFAPQPRSIRGMYLWGGVGRGKTMLMDIFYETLTSEKKLRQHFHHFMLHIHKELNKLSKQQNPLKTIANDLAENTQVLCLDEFHVNDITDAMLMAGLLEALFNAGVCLITTSNRAPDDLYKDGLQRARFIPAIELIKTYTHVVNLDSDSDYRLQTLRKEGTYHHPLNEQSQRLMQQAFSALTSYEECNQKNLEVNGRLIPILGEAEGAVWFEFAELCDSPRAQSDYIEIATEHHSIFISNLPALDDMHNDAARRFLNLLDVFYDHHVKLIISAEVSIENIYSGKRLAFEFERATSRLIEMQSEEYLGQVHLC